jgi:hypothetical protein
MSPFKFEKPLIALNTLDVDTDCLPPEAITIEDYREMGGIPVSHSAQTEENWCAGIDDGQALPNAANHTAETHFYGSVLFN